MDRIVARSEETLLIANLMSSWLKELKPGPPPLQQKAEPIKTETIAVTDAMRGALLHAARIKNGHVARYDIITPTVWNFSPQDKFTNRGPVENALVGTYIPAPYMLGSIVGRIIRSFDPCLSCATHVLDYRGQEITILV